MLSFKPISLDMKNKADRYFFEFGEGSCQHSFVTNFCLFSKYGDEYFEKDDTLYIHRKGLDRDNYRYYLFPMCDRKDEGKVKKAIEELLEDAHHYGKKVKFYTITKTCKDLLCNLTGDRFIIEDNRDLYEYIFNTEKMASLSGSMYQSKRNVINKLYKTYGDSIVIKEINDDNKEELKKFFVSWLEDNIEDDVSIAQNEINEFNIAIDNFIKLGMLGIIVYIEGEIAGFNFGSLVNENTYDGMIQKGDKKYAGIYELLNKATANLVQGRVKYMNFEEDLGVEGLRKAKQMYHPEYLIEKYIATEA